MSLLPKSKMKWRVPKAYRALERSRERERCCVRKWVRPAVFVGIVALSGAVRYTSSLIPGKRSFDWAIDLPLILFAGVFFVYVIPLVYRIVPMEASVFEKHFCIVCGNSNTLIKWEDISKIVITPTKLVGISEIEILKDGKFAMRTAIPDELIPDFKNAIPRKLAF